MNTRMVISSLGKLMLVEAIILIFPVIVALVYGEGTISSFLIPMGALALMGTSLAFVKPKRKDICARDGYLIVSLCWVILSLFGSLPFFISKEIPRFIDALFETVSGFTTTGASILSNVEGLTKSMLFWRSFTHWLGGMGVLVFLMAIIPMAGGNGNLHLMKAESTGPDVGKLVPKSKSTARILYCIYFGLTLALFLLLLVRLPVFDSLALALGTAGTGGFGLVNDSCASYDPYVQIVLTVFMTAFGVNFNIYFLLICKKFRTALKSEELRTYLGIYFFAVIIISLNIRSMYSGIGETLRTAAFQVSSVMTTTGFSSADFNLWPEFSRIVMILIMCVGGSAGSTAGGFKVARVILLVKNARNELRKLSHPKSVSSLTFEGKKVNQSVILSTNAYLVIYVLIFAISLLIISFDKYDTVSNFSAVIATLNNIGPGLNVVGATGNYSGYSVLSKIVFILDMLLGRLEIFPIILMFSFSSLKLKKSVKYPDNGDSFDLD